MISPGGKRSSGLLEARFEECRREARSLLQKLMVEEPSEIDLMTVVGFLGGLTVEEGGLEGADGRILWGRNGAAIRIKAGLWPGRRRFTPADHVRPCLLHKNNPLGRLYTEHPISAWMKATQ